MGNLTTDAVFCLFIDRSDTLHGDERERVFAHRGVGRELRALARFRTFPQTRSVRLERYSFVERRAQGWRRSRETQRESRGFQSRRCGVCEFFGKQQLRETIEAFRIWRRRRRRCLDADADASQGGLTPGVRDRSVWGGADGDGHEGRSGDVRFTGLILLRIRRYYEGTYVI